MSKQDDKPRVDIASLDSDHEYPIEVPLYDEARHIARTEDIPFLEAWERVWEAYNERNP